MFSTPVSLLDRLRRSPDGDAWAKFIDLYSPVFFSWAYRFGLSEHDTADLVQDLFLILVQQMPKFEYNSQSSFRAWLKTIMLNCLRKRWLKRTPQTNVVCFEIEDNDPRLEIESEEYTRHLVQRAFHLMQSEFEPNTWKACWESFVQDRPAEELAQELGMTVNAVYLAKSRVLRRLREELAGLMD